MASFALALNPATANADDGDEEEGPEQSVLTFHYEPAPNLQIAIWLEDDEGNFIEDVFVTQATGKLGIGNRPGIWNFLSSWRFPYGPRDNVLPVWAHRRGKTYPKITFHDSKEAYQDSLGWHESTSSNEPYFCRPLTQTEEDNILDVMSCPSPQTFSTDKGRYREGETSVYPPRNDVTNFDPDRDHPDIQNYGELNDLDAVTGATPSGNSPTSEIHVVRRADFADPDTTLVAWIEVSLEKDGNNSWDFERDDDHYVDQKLYNYGVAWLGQPSVVYRVPFKPGENTITTADSYFGYGEWDGSTGQVYPPDSTISEGDGTGAGRLLSHENPEFPDAGDFRFAVESSGWEEQGSGGCESVLLPPVSSVDVAASEFDKAQVTFDIPADNAFEINKARIYYREGEGVDLSQDVSVAEERSFNLCMEGADGCDVVAGAGDTVSVEVNQLRGAYTYQFAVAYEDACGNESDITDVAEVTTPEQEFQQIDTFCFVATAAWGENWFSQIASLRSFRDEVLKKLGVGRDFVRFYYAYGPAMAKQLERNDYARAVARMVLQPAADLSTALLSAKIKGK